MPPGNLEVAHNGYGGRTALLRVLLKTAVPYLQGSFGGEGTRGGGGAAGKVQGHHAEAVGHRGLKAGDVAEADGIAAHGHERFLRAPVSAVGAPLEAQDSIGRDGIHISDHGGDSGYFRGPDIHVGDIHRSLEGLHVQRKGSFYGLPHPIRERQGEGGRAGVAALYHPVGKSAEVHIAQVAGTAGHPVQTSVQQSLFIGPVDSYQIHVRKAHEGRFRMHLQALDVGAGSGVEGEDGIVHGLGEAGVATIDERAVLVAIEDEERLVRGQGLLADELFHGDGLHAAVHVDVHAKTALTAGCIHVERDVVVGQVGSRFALVVLPFAGEKLRIHFQIKISARHIAVTAFVLDELHLLLGIAAVPDHHVRIFIGRAQVAPLQHFHADVGKAGCRRHLVRLAPVLHEAVYGKSLVGQEIGHIEAGSQRVAMMGDQPEFAGVQFNGSVFGPGVCVAIQPKGFRVIDFNLKVIQGRKFFQT